MAEAFLETKPDSLFPCSAEAKCREAFQRAFQAFESAHKSAIINGPHAHTPEKVVNMWRRAYVNHKMARHLENNERDALGRCKLQCANCNCRMLFNQLECVKADLETTKETLQVTDDALCKTMEELDSTKEILQVTANELDETMEELHSVKCSLEECKKERNEEKRKFSAAIVKMVRSEMSDVRTQLSALNLFLKEDLGEKALEKKAASEAAKAALSASKFIKLRLLMF